MSLVIGPKTGLFLLFGDDLAAKIIRLVFIPQIFL